MSKKVKPVPPLLVEQWVHKELSTGAAKQLQDRYDDKAFAEAVEVVRRSDEQLREPSVVAPMVAGIESRLAQAADRSSVPRWVRRSFAIAPALAAAAALWVVVGAPQGETSQVPNPESVGGLEVTRLKGDEPDRTEAGRVLVYRRAGAMKGSSDPAVEQLHDGSEVRPGDVLQMGFSSNQPFGALLSIDGAGAVTLHFPTSAKNVPRLDKREVLLGYSYELDDSPRFERIFFVGAPQTFSVEAVVAAAKALGSEPRSANVKPLLLPPGQVSTSLLLKKVIP